MKVIPREKEENGEVGSKGKWRRREGMAGITAGMELEECAMLRFTDCVELPIQGFVA